MINKTVIILKQYLIDYLIIPQDIVSLVTYEIEDVYDQDWTLFLSLAILVDGKKQSELIKTVTPSSQFEVSFDVTQLARFAGKDWSDLQHGHQG